MKILFIDGIDFKTTPNLGLGFLLSYLQKKSPKTVLKSVGLAFHCEKEIVTLAKDFHVVGFSCMSSNYRTCLKVAKQIKEASPHTKIVFGGVHPTASAKEIMGYHFVDAVFLGEAEISFCSYLASIESNINLAGKIPGMYYRYPGGVAVTSGYHAIENLDEAGIPAFELLEYDQSDNCATIITSRGCPYTCSYCYNSAMREQFNHKVRRRPVSTVIEECLYHKENGIRYISFSDDLFLLNEEWLSEFSVCYGKK